jgi:hypothetical protein
MTRTHWQLVGIWLVWALVLIGFQTIVQERYQPNRPDRATQWTPNETARNSQNDKPYLLEPFLNNQVSWDSEFYLSIATVGYDDPDIRVVETAGGDYSMNYAFFPLYPLLMRVVRIPFALLGVTAVGASALAGVVIALLGTLGALFALYDLVRDDLGEDGALRTAFYLLIFPTGFFLAQVFTEGLFLALALGCLALLRRKQFVFAAVLAVFAAWTRAIGVLLTLPIFLAVLQVQPWKRASWRDWLRLLLPLAPVAAYGIYWLILGTPSALVQDTWFGRGFDLQRFLNTWGFAWEQFITAEEIQSRVYYGLEFAAVLLVIVACVLSARRYPVIALFSLLAFFIPLATSAPQSLVRYALAVPSVFLWLGQMGKRPVFDRGWTVLSLLLMGMLVSLFTFDMWVA